MVLFFFWLLVLRFIVYYCSFTQVCGQGIVIECFLFLFTCGVMCVKVNYKSIYRRIATFKKIAKILKSSNFFDKIQFHQYCQIWPNLNIAKKNCQIYQHRREKLQIAKLCQRSNFSYQRSTLIYNLATHLAMSAGTDYLKTIAKFSF